MFEGLKDGLAIIHLLEIISDEKVGRYNKNTHMRVRKLENLTTALNFIKDHNIQLASIGPEVFSNIFCLPILLPFFFSWRFFFLLLDVLLLHPLVSSTSGYLGRKPEAHTGADVDHYSSFSYCDYNDRGRDVCERRFTYLVSTQDKVI